MNRKTIRFFFGFLVLLFAVQLLNIALVRRQPAPEPRRFGDPGALTDRRAPARGPADASVTIFLFSDYACPICRALHRDLRSLMASDPKLRIVYRDWPILGKRSRRAARLAIASVDQARHDRFDDELMRRGGALDEASLQAAAARAGIDWPRLQRSLARDQSEIDALIDGSDRFARGLGFSGTPTMVIGSYIVEGRVSLERMRGLVAKSRI